MSNLAHRQSQIQEKRKQTPWRDFVMEITSWFPFMLYKNINHISRYPKTERVGQVIDNKLYNPLDNKVESEFEGNIFNSIQLLWLKKEKPYITSFQTGNENNDFADICFGVKNCYLSFAVGGGCENILYSTIVYGNNKNIVESCFITKNCENIYSSTNITQSSSVFYSDNIENSNNIYYSRNLIGCNDCAYCNDLTNASYCFENQQLTKNDFEKKKQEIKKVAIYNRNKGNSIRLSSHIENAYMTSRIYGGRNLYCMEGIDGASNMFDCMESGLNSKDFYAVLSSGTNSEHLYCSILIANSMFIFYSYSLENCSFCLGCIGLKNKSYCILNKQYTKEERYDKVDEIFGQMERDGTLGQFFPASMNPFYFNDTAAYLIDSSFTKEEVTAKGYLRRDEPIKVDIPEGAKVIQTSDLGQFESFDESGNWKIDPEVLNVIIQDDQGNVYKIVKMEYDFLMKHGLPLPRKHRLDRMKENFRITM